jgi:hypothetical protein
VCSAWETLADLKESYPIEIAEFAVSRGLDNDPAFVWWVSGVLKKRNQIIAAVQKRFANKNFMFGIRVPTSVTEAIQLDRENGNTLWQEEIKKEPDANVPHNSVLVPPNNHEYECAPSALSYHIVLYMMRLPETLIIKPAQRVSNIPAFLIQEAKMPLAADI